MPSAYPSPLNVVVPMAKQKTPFAKLVRKLAHKKHPPKSAKAVASVIGRKAIGQKAMTKRSVAGRKKAAKKKG